MTIHIIDQYQPQRELTVSQVNLELQNGTISPQAMAWKPGLQDWVPVLSLPEIQVPTPPQLPPNHATGLHSNLELNSTAGLSLPPTEKNKNPFLGILANIGISLTYIFLVVITYTVAVGINSGEFNPLLSVFLGTALFRRVIRKRSEVILLKNRSIGCMQHYFRSLLSASWRLACLFIGVAFLVCLSLDIPFRTFRRFHRDSFSDFPKRQLAWASLEVC